MTTGLNSLLALKLSFFAFISVFQFFFRILVICFFYFCIVILLKWISDNCSDGKLSRFVLSTRVGEALLVSFMLLFVVTVILAGPRALLSSYML